MDGRQIGKNWPCVPDRCSWMRFRCAALQGFFDELRHPRRGLVAPTITSSSTNQDHYYAQSSVLDNPNVTLRSNFQAANYYVESKANEEFTFEGV